MVPKKTVMDNKTVALVGAILVLGVAVYGMATGNVPGFSQFSEESPEEEDGVGNGTASNGAQNLNNEQANDGNEGGGNVSESNGGNESETNEELEELAGNTEFTEEELRGMNPERVEELLRRSELTEVCENQGEDYEPEQGNVRVSGPPFNPFMFESMVHDRMNRIREDRVPAADPLNCDPELRERARGHSRLIITNKQEDEEVEINSTEARYEGVCENPRETTLEGLYYLRDTEVNPPEGSVNQRQVRIEDHDDLLREVQTAWLTSDTVDTITNRTATRQGVGANIDRNTQEVVVTYVVC